MAAKKATIAGWLSKVITLSGQKGSPGLVRAGTMTCAIVRGVSGAAVMEAGDWACVSTFKRFYFKPGPVTFADGFCPKKQLCKCPDVGMFLQYDEN